MPLTQPISEIRSQIEELLIEDLAAALNALKERLPETADLRQQVQALLARLNQANKEKIRGILTSAEYELRLAAIRADLFDMLRAMQASDFEEPKSGSNTNHSNAKLGTVLYRVPHTMPVRKPSICKVRVAMDEDAILEDIVLDDEVRLKNQVEVSEWMTAELIDPQGQTFQIRTLNAAKQNIREDGYTQWLFSVTPLIEGVHDLLVKVSLLQWDTNAKEYVPRDISIMETVTIVTEADAPSDSEEPQMKPTGYQFVLPTNNASAVNEHPIVQNKQLGLLEVQLQYEAEEKVKIEFGQKAQQLHEAKEAMRKEAELKVQKQREKDRAGKQAANQKAQQKREMEEEVDKNEAYFIEQMKYESEEAWRDSNIRDKRSGLVMVQVEGGTFQMGDDTDCNNHNCTHQETVKSFEIGKYQVTQADWRKIMGHNPSRSNDCEDCPVDYVSWYEVQIFIKKLNTQTGQNYRLPTEAEWEYAAKGGKNKKSYMYAGSNDLNKVGWSDNNSGRKTQPVGTLTPNNLGIYDMSGNVYEWCQDFYTKYLCESDSSGSGSVRVRRGGSWISDPHYCRVAYRDYGNPSNPFSFTGFRLARTIPSHPLKKRRGRRV